MCTEWQQKSFGFFFGFTGIGAMANDKHYEMATAFPQLQGYYGLLSGLFFTLPYSTVGLFAGALGKSKKRVLILGLLTMLVSSIHFTNGITSSFFIICLMRFLHGAFSSVINPLSFSLVADYFPPEKRGTANAILSTGNFLGVALSSITIILIKAAGWRATYGAMGVIGVAIGLLSAGAMKEPKPEQKVEEGEKKEEESFSLKDLKR